MIRRLTSRISGLAIVAAVALAGLVSSGCYFGEIYPGDPFGREFSLKEIQHRYTSMIRFGRFDKAAIYVHPDVREAFMRDAPDTKDLHFTDYELDPVELDDDHDQAQINVTYTAYRNSTLVVFEINETQYWVRDGITNAWGVVPDFDRLDIKNDAPPDPDGKGEGSEEDKARSTETASVERIEP